MQDVLSRGAAGVVVEHAEDLKIPSDALVLVVEDTTRALGALAARYRKHFDIPVLAVAGSNGKTTTKDMITRVLASTYTVLGTEGNLNNHIGVPSDAVPAGPESRNCGGGSRDEPSRESSRCCAGSCSPHTRCSPTSDVNTWSSSDHCEAVASEEGSVWAALPPDRARRAFVNADDPLVVRTAQNHPFARELRLPFTVSGRARDGVAGG